MLIQLVVNLKLVEAGLKNLKKRTGIHSVLRYGKVASSEKCGAEEFVSEFKDYMEVEGFLHQQV